MTKGNLALQMPSSYVLMDEEEMMYVEGGTKIGASRCRKLAKIAKNSYNNYYKAYNSVEPSQYAGSYYAAYGVAIAMYAYQYAQYSAGSKKKDVDYHSLWNIEVL